MTTQPTHNTEPVTSLVSAASMSGKQYYAIALDTNGKSALPTIRGQRSFGIQQDEPAANAVGKVQYEGESPAVGGGVIDEGDEVTVSATGKLIKATLGDDFVIGTAKTPCGADGRQFTLVIGKRKRGNRVVVPLGTWALSTLDNVNVLSLYQPGFTGEVRRLMAGVVVATGDASGKQAVMKAAITPSGGSITDVTSCVLTIDTDVAAADPDTLGKKIEGVASTAANTFTADDTISVSANNTTPFTSGSVNLFLELVEIR